MSAWIYRQSAPGSASKNQVQRTGLVANVKFGLADEWQGSSRSWLALALALAGKPLPGIAYRSSNRYLVLYLEQFDGCIIR
ncbi:MAG: hypothetical protein HC786_01425 [Richelia sp. CSU_2_1]|nr:hypothetical protein [Microcoleus sp. SU_5_6]NJR20930.1 hypothetical protein [Richelia sp. CSU_2_1]